MNVERCHEVSPEIAELWEHAVKRLETHRGGSELYATIRGSSPEEGLLAALVDLGAVWTANDREGVLALAIVRGDIVEGLFVDPDRRRQGVATTLLRALVASSTPPKDGYALPGDRGMKSLYESFGWKARLLTMRGE